MAALSTQTVVAPQGVPPTFAAAAGGGDTVLPAEGKQTFLMVKNAGGTACVVTVPRYPTTDADGVAVPPYTVSVPITTGERWIGPLTSKNVDPATGRVPVTYSQVVTVTVAAVAI